MPNSALLYSLILLTSYHVGAGHSLESSKHRFGSRDAASRSHIDIFHPSVAYETYGIGVEHPLSKREDVAYTDAAVAFVQSKLGIDDDGLQVHAAYQGSHSDHVYVTQHHQGLPIANAVANVALNKAGKVTALGSSFIRISQVVTTIPLIDVEDAINEAESTLNGVHDRDNFPSPRLVFLARPTDSIALAYSLQVRNVTTGAWYDAFVDAHSGELLSVTNFVAQATYRVLPITKQSLTEGFEEVADPQDSVSSPLGWHNDGKTVSNTTAGNNALAFNVVQSNITIESAADFTFSYVQDPSLDPTTPLNLNAARVNAFYVVNMVHDFAYRYGFTESAFNFQTDNFGLGGRGNDRVDVNVQAQNGLDNAQFTTLPDGVNGIMTLYIWDETEPRRDGSLENDIIVHESTHGITNRLTGGGTAACLQTLESAGLGEGWSDAMAEWTEHTNATISDWVIAGYVTNSSAGIRTHPYSTNKTTNPLTYSSIATMDEIHHIGEVWANILHNVYAALVGAYGFSQAAFTDPSGSEGNIVFLHLFMDALPIQPCNPTFVNARDAWLQADVTRYDGTNKCLLWTVFASRGLGVGASNFTNDFTVPSDC